VLERCLAPEPEDRYPHAAHLAEDLDAYVEDRPVRHARPRGLWARGAVVVVRRRRLLASVCLALAILGGLMGWVAERIAQERRDRALERLAEYWSGGQPDVFRFQWLGRWQPIEPSDAILRARRVLNSYGVLEPGDWRTRVDVAALPSEVRADLELWLLEHAWRLADGLIRRGGSDDLRDALTILERDGHWSRLAPIRERRRWLRERLGLPPVAEVAQASRPEGVAEAYVWGLEFEPQQARRALSQFVLAGARAGGSFWADYRAAAAAYRVALYREASMRLDRCLARYPRNAALLVQQAACQYRLGRLDEAERACERALAIDPMLAEAYRTRAFVRARLAQRGATATDRERFAAVVGRTGRLASHELEWLTAILEDPNGPWPGNDQDQVARFRSDTVDDAELYVLQGIRLEQSGRLAAAFQAYEAAVSANPEHLYAQAALALARFQWALMLGRALQPAVGPLRQSVPRTNPQPLEMRSEILEPFVRIVEHPRFEELVAQRPEALSLITFSWLECLARGRLDAAVEHLTRGLELVRRHENWDLRNDQLAHLQQSRAWMLYGLAHLEARREVRHPTPDGIDRIARWLQEAQAVLPNRVRRWFEKDRVFDPIRSRITAAEAKRG
jgi:tetratricopeptide (TPR) repeat protein